MSNIPKWELGAVKLTTGEDAVIQYVQESSNQYRYIGMAHISNGRSFSWKPMAWTDIGLEFPYCTEGSRNLARPSKKIQHIKGVLLVYDNGAVVWVHDRANARTINTSKCFALITIDEYLREGQGL